MNFKDEKKILALYIFLAVAVAVQFFLHAYDRYIVSRDAKDREYIARLADKFTVLVHDIQIERGLSAGYVTKADKKLLQDNPSSVYHNTDEAINNIVKATTLNDSQINRIKKIFATKNKKIYKKLKEKFVLLPILREQVQSNRVDFIDVIEGYTAINRYAMRIMQNFYFYSQYQDQYGEINYLIQLAKENAGLERAYIYNCLLDNNSTTDAVVEIRQLIKIQQMTLKRLRYLLKEEKVKKLLFTNNVNAAVKNLENSFFAGRLLSKDAAKWFEVSTARIDNMQRASELLSKKYISILQAKSQEENSKFLQLMIFGFIAFLITLYLANLSRKHLLEIKNAMLNLRIASYAFESQEAMTITDLDGKIMRVNKAFCDITGYSLSDVVGKNASVLSSGLHNKDFYAQMWHDILTKGKWSGEIYNKRKNGEIYPERLAITAIKDDDGQVINYLAQFFDITDLKRAEAKAQHEATHDYLTDLPNRRIMTKRLQKEYARSKRHGYYSAFIFIDLDDFKQVNDRMGHHVGDAVLVEIAKRLKENVRKKDFVARLGGDEFCVMLVDLGDDENKAISSVKEFTDALIENINRTILIDEREINLCASVGIRIFPTASDIESSEEKDILSQADVSMYKAKHMGKNQYVFFDQEIEEKLSEIYQLEKDLMQAIDNGQIELYFQPKVDTKTNLIVGAELLARWNHPDRGIMPPADFIYLIKNIGKMHDLNELLLDTACSMLEEQQNGFTGTLSINIGVQELQTERFLQQVKSVLDKYDFNPRHLEIEILENDLIEDFDAVIEQMRTLSKFGVQFSLDDFGVGYSSINYLDKLPVNKIKIDRNFTIRLKDKKVQTVVSITARFAKTYGLKTVLEGIDEQYQLDFAKKIGIGIYQGYLFSKPVEKSVFIEMIAKQNKNKS